MNFFPGNPFHYNFFLDFLCPQIINGCPLSDQMFVLLKCRITIYMSCLNLTISLLFFSQNLEEKLREAGKEFITVLLSEIFPDKLKLFQDVDAYVVMTIFTPL